MKMSMIETIGIFGIIFGFIGTLFQIKKTYKTKSTESFSIIYLLIVLISESLFMFQGILQRSPTYVLSKALYSLYFLFLLAVTMEGKEIQHDKLKY